MAVKLQVRCQIQTFYIVNKAETSESEQEMYFEPPSMDKELPHNPPKTIANEGVHAMPPPGSAASSTDPPSDDGEPATWQEFMTKHKGKKY